MSCVLMRHLLTPDKLLEMDIQAPLQVQYLDIIHENIREIHVTVRQKVHVAQHEPDRALHHPLDATCGGP